MSIAPHIRERLDASERALSELKAAAEKQHGKPDAAAKLQALNSQISAARATRHKLRNALRFAVEHDRKSAGTHTVIAAAPKPASHHGAPQ